MTKSSKLIATLGVVAGLGVAALPLGSVFASQTQQTVAGEVQVDVEVQPAIAMTIVGNNDDNSSYAAAATHEDGVSVYNPGSLSTNEDFDGYDATEAPAAVYNPASLQRSSSYVSLLPNAVADDTTDPTFKSTIKVYTNNTFGYTLTLKDFDTTTALTNQSDNTKNIPATEATTLTAGTAGWGYKVDSDTDWLAVPASNAQNAATIKTRATKTTGGEESVVHYGVATDEDQATGVYTDVIVYTATTNASN